ncbi:hypothetical protein [Burkholderia ubonensis]|uniref:hypothetical protein n=1 Tax=Burkholderia ubonensis TaxID=101571 RepID=UPI00075D3386|nr:hypothetical protein [Burkholderia ubonensis]KVZ62257.1 hypothetical protein WL19_30210 [Burkholderia ubonensis]
MRTIKTYETADGRQFSDYTEALSHEVNVALPDNLAQIINDAYANASCGVALQDEPLMKIVDGITNNLAQVEDILQRIKEGRGKLEGLETVQRIVSQTGRG